MAIKGKEREVKEWGKKVGMFEAHVMAVNPNQQKLEEIYGTTVENDPEYTSEKEVEIGEEKIKEMVKAARVAFILKDVKTGSLFNLSFYLEDRERLNKDFTKHQYINSVGSTSWAEDEEHLPSWFVTRSFRKAKVGEEELYNFVRAWFSNLDYKDEDTAIDLEFKRLIEGDVSVLQSAIKDNEKGTVVALATIRTVEKDGEVKEYQSIYNRAFLPSYCMKMFRTKKFTEEVIKALASKKSKDLKPHERFVVQVSDREYGVKDFYKLSELSDYDPSENIVASDSVLETDAPDY